MLSNSQAEASGNDAEPDPAHARKVIRVNKSVDDMDEADRRLAALGCTPVFKREFSPWSCFSFALSISGLYATIMATFSYPLYAGGAASVVWCWLIGGAGAVALALSIAEISSAYPTSGGLYFALKYLCPEKYLPIVSWVDGWLNLIGTIAGTASAEYSSAQMLLSAISIATGFRYHPTQVHTILTMAGLCVVHGALNSMSTRWLNKLSGTYAIFHVAALLGAAVVLIAMDQNKHTPEYVFTHLEPQSGWSPPAFSFWFGCLSVSWIIANCDGVGRIAEETKNPSTVIPNAMTGSAVVTYVVGFLYSIVLVFCMGDPSELLESPTGMPISQIFYNVMGAGPATLFSMAGFVIMNFVCVTSIQAGSRTIWAFSRDGMLPLSRVWHRLSPGTNTPLPAVWLYIASCIGVNLIGLGSHILITAIFNVCAVALNWSYCIPIMCKLLYPAKFDRGPWHFGKFSVAINIYAVAWNAFLSVIFMLPTHLPVTAENMNYACVVLAATLLFSVAYWYASGKKYYTGPRTQKQTPEGDTTSQEDLPADDLEKGLGDSYVDSPASVSTLALGEQERIVVYESDTNIPQIGSTTTLYASDEEEAGFFYKDEAEGPPKVSNPFNTPSTGSTVSVDQWEDQDVVDVVDAFDRDPNKTSEDRD